MSEAADEVPATRPPLPREDILEAALAAFASRGFRGTSVREVARGLGISHNLIPTRIGTKEDLWGAAVDHGFARIFAYLGQIDLDPASPDMDRLRAVVERFIEACAMWPEVVRMSLQEAVAGGERFDYIYGRWIDPYQIFGAEMLADLHRRGDARVDSVSLMYFMMTAGASGPAAYPMIAARFGEPLDRGDRQAIARFARRATDVIFLGLDSRGDIDRTI